MSGRIYARDGKPLNDLQSFGRLLADLDYKMVGLAKLPGGVEVSTVWLGINHQFKPDGPPLIFETMVFGGPLDSEQERYATEAEAIEGHRRWVVKLMGEG